MKTLAIKEIYQEDPRTSVFIGTMTNSFFMMW